MCEENGVVFIELRIGSVYGGMDDTSILKRISDTIENGEMIRMSTNCECDWEFVHINDVVKVITKCISDNNIPAGIYNVSNGETKPLKVFLIDYLKSKGFKENICFGNQDLDIGCHSIRTDVTRLVETFNLNQLISFKEGIIL